MEKYEKMELTPDEIIARLKKLKMILEDIEKKKKTLQEKKASLDRSA